MLASSIQGEEAKTDRYVEREESFSFFFPCLLKIFHVALKTNTNTAGDIDATCVTQTLQLHLHTLFIVCGNVEEEEEESI